MSINIAVLLDSLHQPLRKALITAAEWGVRGAVLTAAGELAPENLTDTGRRELRRMLESAELEPAGLVYPSRRPLIASEEIDARAQELRRVVELAYQLRAPVVCCPLGPIPDEGTALRDAIDDALADLGQFAERTGAILSLWTGSNDPEQVRRLLQFRETGGLGIGYDPAMLLVSGHDPVAAVGELNEWIVHVHVRDALRGGSPDSSTEVALGRGEVDWPGCLGALEEADYRGFFAIERNTGADPGGDVGRAAEYLHNLVLS